MLRADYKKYTLRFKQPSGTSRGILKEKETWFIFLRDDRLPVVVGIGECGLLRGLSIDDTPDYEDKLKEVCASVDRFDRLVEKELTDFPSIRFGLETAMLDLQNQGSKILYHSPFVERNQPISINGLIWMGSADFMIKQIGEKLDKGFTCLKMKIGAIDFEQELQLLKDIRKTYSADEIELRVDANGAFSPEDALERLKRLSEMDLHSIEQPIKAGQNETMAKLCAETPLPIALDEELIGVHQKTAREQLLDQIKPQYIILKPSLVGGFKSSEEWIALAEERQIGWWATSALESNIGLNAIAQWTATLKNPLPQGLGTGQLYTNNIPSPLLVENGALYFGFNSNWDLQSLFEYAHH